MYRHLFKAYEHDFPNYTECKIIGEVPVWLDGSLLRNGSGKYSVGPDRYNHLFDGLAVIHQYKFEKGKVQYRNKLLDSETKRRNFAANRIVVSEFGTRAVPDPCKSIFTRYFSYYFDSNVTDNAAVNLLQMGDQVYALTETTRVKRIDPKSLETLGEVDTSKLLSLHLNTAHPLQEANGTTYNLGSKFGKNSEYIIFKVPAAAKGDEDPLRKAEIFTKIPARFSDRPSYYHSFAMTENYLVFIEQPLHIHLFKMLKANFFGSSSSEAIIFDQQVSTRFHIIKKSDGEVLSQVYEADPMFFFHTANAYEENNCIALDASCYNDQTVMEFASIENYRQVEDKEIDPDIPSGRMRRYVMPLELSDKKPGDKLPSVEGTTAIAELKENGSVYITPEVYDAEMELVRINERKMGKKYSYVYGLDVHRNMDGATIKKLDYKSKTLLNWSTPNCTLTEPVFVPRPGGEEEDDGVLLVPLLSLADDTLSGLEILDGKTFDVVAKVEVSKDIIIPFSFHGLFTNLK